MGLAFEVIKWVQGNCMKHTHMLQELECPADDLVVLVQICDHLVFINPFLIY